MRRSMAAIGAVATVAATMIVGPPAAAAGIWHAYLTASLVKPGQQARLMGDGAPRSSRVLIWRYTGSRWAKHATVPTTASGRFGFTINTSRPGRFAYGVSLVGERAPEHTRAISVGTLNQPVLIGPNWYRGVLAQKRTASPEPLLGGEARHLAPALPGFATRSVLPYGQDVLTVETDYYDTRIMRRNATTSQQIAALRGCARLFATTSSTIVLSADIDPAGNCIWNTLSTLDDRTGALTQRLTGLGHIAPEEEAFPYDYYEQPLAAGLAGDRYLQVNDKIVDLRTWTYAHPDPLPEWWNHTMRLQDVTVVNPSEDQRRYVIVADGPSDPAPRARLVDLSTQRITDWGPQPSRTRFAVSDGTRALWIVRAGSSPQREELWAADDGGGSEVDFSTARRVRTLGGSFTKQLIELDGARYGRINYSTTTVLNKDGTTWGVSRGEITGLHVRWRQQ